MNFLWLACLVLVAFGSQAEAAGPTTVPSLRDRQRAADLSRRASELIDQHKLVEAESTLRQSLEIIPDHPTRLYNLACILAAQGKPEAAVDALERATEAGFTDFTFLIHDHTLDPLHDLPRYQALLDRQEEVRHHAAEHGVAALRAEFGDGYLYEADEQMKFIFAASVDAPTLALLKHDLELQANTLWATLFEHRSDEFIRVVVPSAADFRRLVPMTHVGGRYDDDTRTVIVQHLGQFMAHEFTHALHAADQHAVGQEHAVWISEGLASLYESAREVNGALVPGDNARMPVVRIAARRHTLIPLDGLVKMPRDAFGARADLAYGESSCLMLYLHEQGTLRRFYDEYKKTWRADPTGHDALERTTGQVLAELQKSFADWIQKRPEPVAAVRTNGPMLGVRFAEAVDGLRVMELIHGSPAALADLRIDDMLVALNGKEALDRKTFDALLAVHEPGDEVTIKIRRGKSYLEKTLILGRRSAPAAPR